MRMIWSRHKDSAKTERATIPVSPAGILPPNRRRGEEIRVERTWPVNSPGGHGIRRTSARSTRGGNLVNEIAHVSFDLVARQTIARLGVWQAEIAADDEGAQPFAG
jgi:hypothetical protein